MTIPISVTIPVGPSEANKRWLQDCIESVFNQEYKADEILIIDDQAGLFLENGSGFGHENTLDISEAFEPMTVPQNVRLWKTPWKSGVAHAFNFGVALARNELVVMLGSDDVLEPWALADLEASFQKAKQEPLGYYFFDVKYMDTGEVQRMPCHAAAVTKSLMKHTGGFPVESAVGAPDTMLLSIMMAHEDAGAIVHVNSKEPPYLYRRHPETYTAQHQGFPLSAIRDKLTADWKPR